MPVEINGEPWVTWEEVRELALEQTGVRLGPLPRRLISVFRIRRGGEVVFPLGAVEARIEHWAEAKARDVERRLSRPATASE